MNNKALQYSPRISVVIVTYNFAAYLRECIESILAQTLRPFEIVIYDDCSNDESWDIITEYRDRYPDQFVVHRQENNVGMHRNVNDALRRARGELVSCLDGDDRWLPRKLEAEWNAICRNPGARAAYSNVFSVTPQGERVAVWHDGKGQEPPSGDVFVEVFSKRFFPGMRSIFRNPLMFRSDLEVLAYHDEEIELYIDWDLKIRLAAAVPVVYSGEALVDYRIHEGGIHNLPLDTHMRDLVRIYRKNRHLLEQRTEAEQAFIESEIESLAREYGGSMEAVIGETKPSAGAAEAFGGGRTQPEAACVSSGEELVFLVSLPRSGSTVLQRVLAGHPEVHSTAEPWLMLHPLYALKTAGIEAEYDARLARQALGEFLDTIPGGEENYYEGVRAMASVLYRRALKTSGKRLFLDKTPRYFYILPELAKTFPKAKFVLLLRNPVAVMSSMLRTWFGNDTRTLRAHRHYRDLTEGVRLLAEAIPLLGERAICVHYEDLIADAEHTVRTVCAHLGIRFSAEMLNYGRGRPPAGSFGDSRSVHRHDSVVGDYVDTWREHLSTGETRQFALEYLDEMDDGVMAVLGYSKAGLVSALNGGADGGVRTAEVRTAAETARPAGRGALVEELNSRGEEAFRKGDIDTASAAFEAAYAMDGSDPEVLNNLLVVRWQMGEEEQALHYLAQALDRDPFYRDTVINGGQILAALGEGAKAADLYDAYLTVHSDEEIRGLRAALESGTAGHAQGMEREGVSGEDNGILVSAIVSTYNSEDLIEGCLQDLLAQTIADRIEIIVIDSASEQNERDIVERYQRQHSCIRYVRTPQRETIYAAWNRAIGMARGRYLTNANTDDRHRPDALERMARVLDEHPDVSLVYANCAVTAVPNCTFHDAPVQGYFRWPEHDARHLFSVCYVGPQPMWRRSLHDRYGAFDADMRVAGDYEFWLRLAPHEKFLHVPEDLGLYLCSADSVQHKYAEEAARETLLARQRNWPASWGAMPTPGRNYLVPVVGGSKENDGGDASTLVSIIMPTKDRPELLPRAVDSVLSQSYTSWELIVVNDGGVGIEGSLGERLRDSRIRCVSLQRSVGQAAARNIALQEANGEIICYLDDDDAYLEDHLRTVVGVLANGDRAFAYTDAVVVPEEFAGGVLREVGERSNPYAHESYSRDRLLVNNYIPINTWAHRRSCLDEIGLFDESLTCYEDWEFLLRLSARHEFMHVPSTTVEVRFRVDREDNVTRRRLADTEAAYRTIYQRHNENVSPRVQQEREMKLEALAYHTSRCSTEADAASRSRDSAPEHEQAAENRPVDGGSDRARQQLEAHFLHRAGKPGYRQPSIHLVMLAKAGDEAGIADTIDSLGQQIYPGWGLSIVSEETAPSDEFDRLPMLEWIQSSDPVEGFMQTLRTSQCEWIGWISPGDTLEPDALSTFVDYVNLNPEWKFIYCDEDSVDGHGTQLEHRYKPDANPELLRSCPYIGNLSLVHRGMLPTRSVAAMEPEAVFYALALQVLETEGARALGHIPTLLFHRLHANCRSEESGAWVKGVLEQHLRNSGIDAEVRNGVVAGTCRVHHRCPGDTTVCIVIRAGANPAAAERTVASVLQKTAYRNWSLYLGINRELAPLFAHLDDGRVRVELLDADTGRCSYFNDVSERADAELLVFLEPGTIVLQDEWLDHLVAQGQREEVGAVGARVVSGDRRVAHAGIVVGAGSYGVGDYVGKGASLAEPGYMQRLQLTQNMSAVSSACMLTKRGLFRSLGGFDATLDVTLYQDVDYCLRIAEAGRSTVWTPLVTVLLSEGELGTYEGTGGLARVQKDAWRVQSRWLRQLSLDPAYNRNLNLKKADFSLERGMVPAWDPALPDVPRITGGGAGSFSSWIYRVEQPLDALAQAGMARFARIPFSGDVVEALPSAAEMERMKPDVLLLHNTVHDHFIEAMRNYRKLNGVFVIFGQDDLMFAVPPKSSVFNSTYRDMKKRVRSCLSLADRLLVTSESLADELSGMIDDIRVLPNRLDARVWGALESRRGTGRKPRVGWAGAQQHYGDLEILADVVRETAAEVEWVFMGMCPDFLRPYVSEVHPYTAFERYPETLAGLNLDLAVAPLERNRFNRCKSNLRLLEYGALGWPVIATDIEPYRGAPVQLVSNQSRAWIRAIRDHVNNPEESARQGDRLRDWVRGNFLQNHLEEWLEALDPQAGSRSRPALSGKASSL